MAFFDFLKRKEIRRIAELEAALEKYARVIDAEAEASRIIETAKSEADVLHTEAAKIQAAAEDNAAEIKRNALANADVVYSQIKEKAEELAKLSSQYSEALNTYKALRREVGIYESKLDTIEFGIYEPVYDFERSEEYREAQNAVVEREKQMIKDDNAALCSTTWTVGDSEAKGRAMVNRYKKLMLRAFNGECDSLIAKVKWNNVMQSRERMSKLYDAINKLGENMSITITPAYYKLKQDELTLEYEYQAKRQKEKEEMRMIQEELREEEKARREFELAQRAAEKEEATYLKALEKARREVAAATGDKQIKLQAQIDLLQQQLLDAASQKERAISMAQQTKRGHVYIISNIGSFGEGVYKIGMTRRLEPTDRIKELGDASVPFQFDIHAMIFCEDAPFLENALHRAFNERKVNMLNYKKEFFYVSIDDIEMKLKEIGVGAEFVRLPEAREYRETRAIIEKLATQQNQQTASIDEEIRAHFPDAILQD